MDVIHRTSKKIEKIYGHLGAPEHLYAFTDQKVEKHAKKDG